MNALRALAILIGLFFLTVGVMGLMPMFFVDNKLLGVFLTDQWDSLAHVGGGAIFLIVSANARLSKVFFILFGLIILAVSVLGFIGKEDLIRAHFNMADNVLHLVVGLVLLLVGILVKSRRPA